ncbi:MAG: YceI family protein [Nitriliruptoraceae bacterium]
MSAVITLPAVGTYTLDPSHSSVEFVVRHLMVAKVRGRFTLVSADLTIAEAFADTTLQATIDAASLTTGDEQRDAHVTSADFLEVTIFPHLSFSLRELNASSTSLTATGRLTIRDVTQDVVLDVDYLGEATDPWGNAKVAFSASTTIDREAFGITWNQALETGGVLVGKTVTIEIDAQFAKNA